MAGGEDHCCMLGDLLLHAMAPEAKSAKDKTRAIINFKYFIPKQYPVGLVFVNLNKTNTPGNSGLPDSIRK